MDRILCAFIAAAFSSLFWPVLPSAFWLAITGLLVSALCLKKLYFPAAFLSGLLWMASVGHSVQLWQLSQETFSQPAIVVGHVDSLVSDKTTSFELTVETVQGYHFSLFLPRIRLNWHQPLWALKQGQRVQLEVKLKPPYGLANESGFNYQQWLFANNIAATGYVRKSELNAKIDNTKTLRQSLLDKMQQRPESSARWLMAMTLGHRAEFSQSDWHLLQATGTAHLFAISGLHLGMLASFILFLSVPVICVVCRYFSEHNFVNIKLSAMGISLVCCLGYSYLAGFSIPTLRAFVLLFLVLMMFRFGIHWPARRLILVSLSVIVILFPLSLWQLSFWLSYSAIIAIWIIAWRSNQMQQRGLWSMLKALFLLQCFLSLLMLPVTALFFSGISWLSPLINIVAVPFVTLILLPLSLISLLIIAFDISFLEWLLQLCLLLFQHTELQLLHALQRFPAWVKTPELSLLQFAGLIIAIAVLILPRLFLPKWTSLVFLIPLFPGQNINNNQQHWHAHILDVGQGLAVLIEKQKRVLLYDTGASYPSGFNMAQAVIIPMLQSKGIQIIDKMIISHSDNDHAGGATFIEQQFSIAETVTAEQGCVSGRESDWNGLKIRYLWPEIKYSDSDNNNSCVVHISDGHHSLLLTGDIELEAERRLARMPDKVRANVMLGPHHGSKTSSSAPFINAVAPQLVIFSQGFNNRWQLPHQEVLQRYREREIQTLNTSSSGQISIRFSSTQPFEVERIRETQLNRWFLPPRHN